MKAVLIDRPKTSGELGDIPEPALQAGSVLVRINAAGVNPIDWKSREREGAGHTFPLVLGRDFAGVVERAAKGVTRLRPGDRVFGFAPDFGAFAEKTLVPGATTAPIALIPDALGDEMAAALPTPALTALASLAVLEIKSGSSLLVVGGAGAVGGAAVAIAHQRGASVTAFVLPHQEAQARAFGADTVVTGSEGVRAARSEPFEAVLDLVSDGSTLQENAILVRPGGALASTVHAADAPWFSERGITATNIVLTETPEYSIASLEEIARLAVGGRLPMPLSGERPLAEAVELLDGMKAGRVSGKFILRIG